MERKISIPMAESLKGLSQERNIMVGSYKINPEKLREYFKSPFISSIPEMYKRCTLDNLMDNGEVLKIRDIIINEWNNEPITLLSNTTGSGKTHIACACARLYLQKKIYEWIEQNKDTDFGYSDYAQIDCNKFISRNTPVFYNESDIYGMITGTYNKFSINDEIDIINYLGHKTELIIIDDMFASRQNEFARGKMYDIINQRICYNGLPTIITSNLTLKEIAEIDNRIASRLIGKFCFVINQAEDFRKKLLKEKS
jgi:DNA replication protein DnaC